MLREATAVAAGDLERPAGAGTQEDRKTGEWKDPVKRKAVGDRQIRHCQVKRDED